MNTKTKTIYEFETKCTNGYIGSVNITYSIIFTLLFKKIKNTIDWIFIGKNKSIKIWAIDDNEHNYSIYIENHDS